MTYREFSSKSDIAKTIFVCGVESALSVEIASNEQKISWILNELSQLKNELAVYKAEYDKSIAEENAIVQSILEEQSCISNK